MVLAFLESHNIIPFIIQYVLWKQVCLCCLSLSGCFHKPIWNIADSCLKFCWVSGRHVASYGDVAILLSFYTSQWSYCSCIVLLQALLQCYRHEDSYSCKGVVGCGVYAHTPLVLLQVYSRVSLSIRSSGETETQLEKPQNNYFFSSIETDLFSFSIYLSNILLRCYLSLLSRVRTVVEVTLTLPSNKALLLNTGLCLDLRWWGSHPREPCRIQEKCVVAQWLAGCAVE